MFLPKSGVIDDDQVADDLGMLQALRMDHCPLSYKNDPPLHLLATGLITV